MVVFVVEESVEGEPLIEGVWSLKSLHLTEKSAAIEKCKLENSMVVSCYQNTEHTVEELEEIKDIVSGMYRVRMEKVIEE